MRGGAPGDDTQGAAARAADVATAAQLACLLEASAPKPGNVSPGRHFHDARFEDFLASAAAIGPALASAGGRPLGASILRAAEATARWTRSNTNLGMVLALAPLAKAALGVDAGHGPPAFASGGALRAALRRVLAETTVEDARDAYRAIRLSAPGGMGRVGDQDVASEPTVTLAQAMGLAADRDAIAREYVTAFQATFEIGAPALERARAGGLEWDEAVVETFLAVLAAVPDTHVARRRGAAAAEQVSRMARSVLDAGGVRSDAGRRAVAEMDAALRGDRNALNPGTTADLTAAAVFVVLLGGGWHTTHGGLDAAER